MEKVKMDIAGEMTSNSHNEVESSHWDPERIEGCTIDGNRLRQINNETGYAYSRISMRAVDQDEPPPYKIQFAWSIQILNSNRDNQNSVMNMSIGIATWPAISKRMTNRMQLFDSWDRFYKNTIMIQCHDGQVFGASEKGTLGGMKIEDKLIFYFDSLHKRLTVKKNDGNQILIENDLVSNVEYFPAIHFYAGQHHEVEIKEEEFEELSYYHLHFLDKSDTGCSPISGIRKQGLKIL